MTLSVIILAAGQNKRMNSYLPKVLRTQAIQALMRRRALATVSLLLAAMQGPLAQTSLASGSNARAVSESPQEIAFDRQCTAPALPLDGAPIVGLSVEHAPPFTPPYDDARPGALKLHLLVNEQGWVVRARVAKSYGEPRMDEAVMRWLGEWRFKPRFLDSQPVCAWGTYSLSFDAGEKDTSVATEPPKAAPAPIAPQPSKASPATVAPDEAPANTEVWVPPDVATNALTRRFEAACASDPRQFSEAPADAGKLPVQFPSAATLKVPPVPASFRRAHPELRDEEPTFVAVLALLINEEGRVAQARIRRSTGFDELDEVALGAAGEWRMRPALLRGKPTCAWGVLGVNLKRQSPR